MGDFLPEWFIEINLELYIYMETQTKCCIQAELRIKKAVITRIFIEILEEFDP